MARYDASWTNVHVAELLWYANHALVADVTDVPWNEFTPLAVSYSWYNITASNSTKYST